MCLLKVSVQDMASDNIHSFDQLPVQAPTYLHSTRSQSDMGMAPARRGHDLSLKVEQEPLWAEVGGISLTYFLSPTNSSIKTTLVYIEPPPILKLEGGILESKYRIMIT